MTTTTRRALAITIAISSLAALAAAGQQKPAPPASSRFGNYVIRSDYLEGNIGGAWEFSKGVTLTGPDITVTCDRLQVWPTKTGTDIERAEASGNVIVRGRYLGADKTEWKVTGTSASASYDAKAGQGVLRGGVKFDGANLSTGATVSVVADKLSYDFKTQRFRFDRGATPVRVQWQEPEQPAPAAAPAQEKAGK